jgi:hypothetical protein
MFEDITNCPADDTRFRLRAIFQEGAQLVDSMVNEIQGEAVRLTTIEARLDSIESRLDLVLQCLPRPLMSYGPTSRVGTCGQIIAGGTAD